MIISQTNCDRYKTQKQRTQNRDEKGAIIDFFLRVFKVCINKVPLIIIDEYFYISSCSAD